MSQCKCFGDNGFRPASGTVYRAPRTTPRLSPNAFRLCSLRPRPGCRGAAGGGFALDLLPPSFPSHDRALPRLPHILHGDSNLRVLGELIAWPAGVSFV